MVACRLYCLDGMGRIELADWIEATDDDDAVRQARTMKHDYAGCEVWQKDRLVAKMGDRDLSG